jgi:hypothetical protein
VFEDLSQLLKGKAMKVQLYTHGRNMSAERAFNAMSALGEMFWARGVEVEVHYFDGDITAWFGTAEQVKKHSREGFIVIHVDGLILKEVGEEYIAELSEKFGMLAVTEPNLLITKEGRKGETELLRRADELLALASGEKLIS